MTSARKRASAQWPWVLALGAWALAFATAARADETPAADGGKGGLSVFEARDTPSKYCLTRLLAPLRMLSSTPPLAAASDWQDDVAQAASDLRAALRSQNDQEAVIETLIASVADPIESGLVHQFETSLQALRTGAEYPLASGGSVYFRDRSFLPWDDREAPAGRRAESEACRAVVPGIMLFRNSDTNAPRVLAMLLVGETPTAGMRGSAMLNALRIAHVLEGQSAQSTNDDERRVRVVGPVFSGSAYSLRLALRRYAEELGSNHRLHYEIISGTANGSEVPELLERQPFKDIHASLQYRATIAPDRDIECAYLWFLHTRLDVAARELPADVFKNRTSVLPEVATLSESGTEFGAREASPETPEASERLRGCDLQPGLSLAFPIHVSNLRDAYESMDQKTADSADGSIARATSLDAPLSESRKAQDVEADPSSKTRAALDVMLTSTLGELSRRGIRHVAIRATDVGDAIFLARKIRDVTPDVRLAFFDADGLLLHPDFRSLLFGSIVVTDYPFLDVNNVALQLSSTTIVHGFPNALTEGMFNAVIAQRGGGRTDLRDYMLGDAVLPVWISTISRAGLEPIDLKAVHAPDVLYQPVSVFPAEYVKLRAAHLPIDGSVPLPRLWMFVVLGLALLFALDEAWQSTMAQSLSDVSLPAKGETVDDHVVDRAIARTNWWLYAVIRRGLFAISFGYFAVIYVCVLVARDYFSVHRVWEPSDALHGLGCLAIMVLVFVAARRWQQAFRQFTHDYTRFGHHVGERLLPRSWRDLRAGIVSGRVSMPKVARTSASPPSGVPRSPRPPHARWSFSLGLDRVVFDADAAGLSFAQLRTLTVLASVLAVWFLICLGCTAYASVGGAGVRGLKAVPTLTLNVLRNLPLANGSSPATPALLCIACVYAWVVGRMARIAAAHQLSRIAPRDDDRDLVSTPMRSILYPSYIVSLCEGDDGFTHCERDALNAIWRPFTGRNYVAATLAVTFIPVLLFTAIKPLSTLETRSGTVLLASGLALATSLIGVTLIQQLQYWLCFKSLLQRILAHRIAPAFRELPAFARDSIDAQISRTPDELLRWAGCARQFEELTATLDAVGYSTLLAGGADQMRAHAEELAACRARALSASDAPDDEVEPVDPRRVAVPTQTEAAVLCEQVIACATSIMRVVESAWNRREPHPAVRAHIETTSLAVAVQPLQAAGHDAPVANLSLTQPLAVSYESARAAANDAIVEPVKHALPFGDGDDALVPVAHCFDVGEVQWLRRAQVFVATVITLLIHRHVRQFRHFATTLTAAAVLLLLALTSYPFEPFRLLLTCTWVVVGTVVAAGLWIYVQLHRDTLLSLISGTPPNKVTFDGAFFLRLFAWAGVPLLSVAAAQYPDLANLLFKIVAPFVRALH